MLSSVALLIEINFCNLLVQMLFFLPWLNAITRGEYLYFIILLINQFSQLHSRNRQIKPAMQVLRFFMLHMLCIGAWKAYPKAIPFTGRNTASSVSMMLPIPPLPAIAGLGVAAAYILQILNNEKQAKRFSTMQWAEASNSQEGDGCVLIGVEDSSDGYGACFLSLPKLSLLQFCASTNNASELVAQEGVVRLQCTVG